MMLLDAQQPTSMDSLRSLPFALPELELGNMRKRTVKRKAPVAEDDDDDPREEAQVVLCELSNRRTFFAVCLRSCGTVRRLI